MKKTKDKNLKQLKRKRIWPALVMFIIFAALCVFIVLGAVQFFASYIVGEKLTKFYDDGISMARLVDQLIRDDENVEEFFDSLTFFGEEGIQLYLTDDELQPVAATCSSRPTYEERSFWTIQENYSIMKDDTWEYGSEENLATIFTMPLDELYRETFRGVMGQQNLRLRHFFERKEDQVLHQNLWMKDVIIRQQFWMEVPLQAQDYRLFVRNNLEVQRLDIIYVFVLGGVAIAMLLVPLCFLFSNTISMVLTQQRVRRMLYTDQVTKGHNWLYFQSYGSKMISRYLNNRKAYAMVNLHMEHYQNYCACYGNKQGVDLLQCMDGFLRARMTAGEVYGHHGNADFALIIRCEGDNEEEWKAYCNRRLRSLLAELTGLKPDQKLHFHAGVYLIEPGEVTEDNRFGRRKETDIDQAYVFANTAQSIAHINEEQQIFFFNEKMLQDTTWEHKVENMMEAALANGEFVVYLQPKYSPSDERLVAAEALIRWMSPTEGMIPPGRFIPIFESNGFITKIDDYMISQVAKLQAEWKIQGKKTVPISVNVSRAHFSQEGLAGHISRLVDAYGPKHDLIELELTESAFFDDKELLIDTVKQMKAYGFTVSMDDFGAGYSSLNSLKDIPLDVLKLDADFFRGENAQGRGAVIVKQAIALAKELDMKVVAEGVEYREQVDFLASVGCDMIQGYYFAKPMPVSEFEQRVAADA